MPQIKFYEIGLSSGDWMILDELQRRKSWAIVLDHGQWVGAQWGAIINGHTYNAFATRAEVEDLIRSFLDGRESIPQ